MSDTTIKKVESKSSPRGEMGQKYLVAGKRVSMRFWALEPGGELKLLRTGSTRRLDMSYPVAHASIWRDKP